MKNLPKYIKVSIAVVALCVGLILLVIGIFIGTIVVKEVFRSELTLTKYFDDWTSETENVPYYFDSSLAVLYKTDQKEGVDLEDYIDDDKYLMWVIAVVDDTIWFLQSDEDSEYIYLSALSMTGEKTVTEHLFFLYEGYPNNLSVYPEESTGVFYQDRKIYIRTSSKCMMYDIDYGVCTDIPALPTLASVTWDNTPDYDGYVFKGEQTREKKTVTLERMAELSDYAAELYQFSDNHMTGGTKWYFDDVQVIDGEIYILTEVYNSFGTSEVFVFRYDFEEDKVYYVLNTEFELFDFFGTYSYSIELIPVD